MASVSIEDLSNQSADNSLRLQWRLIKKLFLRKDDFESLSALEWFIMLLFSFTKVLFPGFYIRWYFNKRGGYIIRNQAVEAYVIIKLAIILLLLFYGNPHQLWVRAIAAYFIFDLMDHILGMIFLYKVNRREVRPTRNLVLMILNVMELVGAFAILYVGTDSVAYVLGSNAHLAQPIDAYYFSLVTFTTVGYGEIVPISGTGRMLVIFEIFCSFLFIAILLANLVAKLNLHDIRHS